VTPGVALVVAVVLAAAPWWAGPARRGGVAPGADAASPTRRRWRGPGPGPGPGPGRRPGQGTGQEEGPALRPGPGGLPEEWRDRRDALRGRRGGRAPSGEPGTGLLLVLVEAALGSGAPVARALEVVGAAWPGVDGAHLVRAARRLALGTDWATAWQGATGGALVVARALQPTWTSGAAAGPALRAAADSWRRRRRAAARTAAARLGVHLLLPTGLCLLPAFVLLGVVPVVAALAAGLLG